MGVSPSFNVQKALALLAPIVPIVSGALATWLFVHVQFLGIFHVDQSAVNADIAGGITFALTAGLVWLSTHLHTLPLVTAKVDAGIPAHKVTVQEILAFLAPYVAILAGAVTTWAFVHLHFLGVFHLDQGSVASTIAAAISFGVSAVIVWAAHNLHFLPIAQMAASMKPGRGRVAPPYHRV